MIESTTSRFISEHKDDDIHALSLKISGRKDIDVHLAIRQIQGYQSFQKKVPSWTQKEGILYPDVHLPLEQCSSEWTGLYKRNIIANSDTTKGRFADLTGGMGIDFSFLAPQFKESHYVERQEQLCEIAENNFKILDIEGSHCHNEDSIQWLESAPTCDWIMLDPARRGKGGGKMVLLEDCEPNLLEIKNLLLEKASHVLIKLSPIMDLQRAAKQLGCVQEAHIVSFENECKELLLVLDKEKQKELEEIPIHCVNIKEDQTKDFIFTLKEERTTYIKPAALIENYLYEPNASIMKAGGFHSIEYRYDIRALSENSHLFTSNDCVKDFPGRSFRVLGCTSLNKKELKKQLQGISKANITTRNYPMSAEELRKKLQINEGGDIYLMATTLSDRSKVIAICEKVQ